MVPADPLILSESVVDNQHGHAELHNEERRAINRITRETIQAAIAPWFAAASKTATRRANIVMIGDSLTEGFPVTDGSLTIGRRLAAALRTNLGLSAAAGGRGFRGIPTAGVAGLQSPWVVAGMTRDPSAVGVAEAFGYGASRNCAYTNGAGSATYTVSSAGATALDLHVMKSAAGNATAGRYRINGGAWVTFSTANATTAVQVIRINGPIAANATVEVGCSGTGYVIVLGMVEYNGDELQGLLVHNAGHCGYSANKWQAASVSPAGSYLWRDDIELLSPDLIVIELGINDGNSAGQARSSATFKADLLALVAVLRAAPSLGSVPILLMPPYDVSAGVVFVDPWSKYLDAVAAVASSQGCGFLNLTQRMPPTSTDPVDIYDADNVHGKSDGSAYWLVARHLARVLTP